MDFGSLHLFALKLDPLLEADPIPPPSLAIDAAFPFSIPKRQKKYYLSFYGDERVPPGPDSSYLLVVTSVFEISL